MNNLQRAAWGREALTAIHGTTPGASFGVPSTAELLRDIMHYCDNARVSFADALAEAGKLHHRDIIADVEAEARDE
jgi:hypothetical protein